MEKIVFWRWLFAFETFLSAQTTRRQEKTRDDDGLRRCRRVFFSIL
jgi:hypothetical protein